MAIYCPTEAARSSLGAQAARRHGMQAEVQPPGPVEDARMRALADRACRAEAAEQQLIEDLAAAK